MNEEIVDILEKHDLDWCVKFTLIPEKDTKERRKQIRDLMEETLESVEDKLTELGVKLIFSGYGQLP